jgi:hypothetical protein
MRAVIRISFIKLVLAHNQLNATAICPSLAVLLTQNLLDDRTRKRFPLYALAGRLAVPLRAQGRQPPSSIMRL